MFKFIDEVLEIQSVNAKAVTPQGELVSMALGHGAGQYGDQESLNKVYENLVWVYRCVNFIATNLAQLPWRVVKINADDEVQDDLSKNPLFDILFKPNNFQTRYDFLIESISRLELQGEMYWQIDWSQNLAGRILALYADWRSQEVRIFPDPKTKIAYYERTINGKAYTYWPEEVFYIKYFNPFDDLRGMSPVRAGRHSVILEMNALGYNKKFFTQGARPSGVFTTEQDIGKTEADRMRDVLTQQYSDINQMHKFVVLWGGVKFSPLNTMSMNDIQFQEMRKMNREDIVSGCYGLSLEALGFGERTYENVWQARKMALTDVLRPKNEKVISLINEFFLPAITKGDPTIKVQADYSEIEALKEDKKGKLELYDKGFKTASITPNEIRTDVFEMEPIDDPAMNTTYLPNTALPSGSDMIGEGTPPGQEGKELKKKDPDR